ncbi:nuclear transport factor 2 family protein [Kutzneria viridogrisea]|uniref:3-phenylpropionate/cinnamic acid dioxygenase small subunit n=1 Tax=Kutzneria viridogrisea TaxID=47990 RepID=A0ABR6BAG7_9PSEU|nr:3-phenylpropionate/cinnamic acid dioxygenase small subunit [Kutzneria viridogrisea]
MTQQLAITGVVSADVYQEVVHFYARHMHLLDAGAAAEWAATFVDDCLMDLPNLEPVHGRTALAEMMAKSIAQLRAGGEQRRHWHGMITVDEMPGGELAVRCYALVFSTLFGGEPRLHRTCVCHDVLVREGGTLKVRSRRVTRDDLNTDLS